MFKLGKEILEELKKNINPLYQPALEGPQIYYACAGCSGSCKNSCEGTCKGSCKGGCTRSCKGSSR